MLSYKAPQHVLGNGQQQTSSKYESALSSILQLNNSSVQKSAISVKLTDDCLQNLQQAAINKYPVLVHVNKTEVVIEIKTAATQSLKFCCFLQRVPTISFQALQKTENTFDDIAHILMRAQVKPTQQTLQMGREKIQQVSKLRERENNKCRTQMLPGPVKPGERKMISSVKPIGSRVPITNNASMRNGSNVASSIPPSLGSIKSITSSASTNPSELRDCALRVRVVHYIAAGRYNLPNEIVEHIMNEGVPKNVPIESARRKIREIICEVAVEYNDPPRITLDPKYFREVDINWNFYEAADRENANKVLAKTEVAAGSNFAPTRASRRAPMMAPRRKQDNVTPTMTSSTATSPDLASDLSNCSTPSPSNPSAMSIDSGYSPSSCEKRKISLTDLPRIPEDDSFSVPPVKKRFMDSETVNKPNAYDSSSMQQTETLSLISDSKAKSMASNGCTPSPAKKNDHVVATDTSTDSGSPASSTNNDEVIRYKSINSNNDSRKAIDANIQQTDVKALSRASSAAVIVEPKSKNSSIDLHDSLRHQFGKEKTELEIRRAKLERQHGRGDKVRHGNDDQYKLQKERSKLEKQKRREQRQEREKTDNGMSKLDHAKFMELAKDSAAEMKAKEERKKRRKEEAERMNKSKEESGVKDSKNSEAEQKTKPPKSDDSLSKPKEHRDKTKIKDSLSKPKEHRDKTKAVEKPIEIAHKKHVPNLDMLFDDSPPKIVESDKTILNDGFSKKHVKDADNTAAVEKKSKKIEPLKEGRKAEKRHKPRSEEDNASKISKIEPSQKSTSSKPEKHNAVKSDDKPMSDDLFSTKTSRADPARQSTRGYAVQATPTVVQRDESKQERSKKDDRKSRKAEEKHGHHDSLSTTFSDNQGHLSVDREKRKERSKSERRPKDDSRRSMSHASVPIPPTSESRSSSKFEKLSKHDKVSSDRPKDDKAPVNNDKHEYRRQKAERKTEKELFGDAKRRPKEYDRGSSSVATKPSVVENVNVGFTKPSADSRKLLPIPRVIVEPSKEAEKPRKEVVTVPPAVVKKGENESKPLIIQPAEKLSKPVVRKVENVEEPLNVKQMPLRDLLKMLSDPVESTKCYEKKYPVIRTASEAEIYTNHEIEYYKLYEKTYHHLIGIQRDLNIYVERMNNAESVEERTILDEKIRFYAGNVVKDEMFINQRKTVANMTKAIQVLRSRLEEFYGPGQKS